MPAKLLGDLLPEFVDARAPHRTVTVSGITEDSRQVRPGSLFAAVRGLRVDGHEFITQAVTQGAVAILAERPIATTVPVVVVPDVPRALGQAASQFYDRPSDELSVIGITGTNGKTTTSYLIESMLTAARHATGVLGTVTYRYPGHSQPAPFTTPGAVDLQSCLADMVAHHCRFGVLEVSSHGLSQGRIWGTEFSVAAFSHLSQDHLDFHQTMAAYLAAKLLLFKNHLRAGGAAVVNVDRDGGAAVVDAVKQRGDVRLIRCSNHGADAEARLLDVATDLSGLRGTLELSGQRVAIESPLVGSFNAENILLAAGCAHALNVSGAHIAAGIATLRGVPGRLERVDGVAEFPVFVDYAHTPDALVRALGVLRPLCKGRLITVFGCGGDRDRKKRPLMGRAVGQGSDIAVVTSDNPRSEQPQAIIDEILPGLRGDDIRSIVHTEIDRSHAIQLAINLARPGDAVLIAGKGHEDYQIIGKERLHFDDREQARLAWQHRKPA